MPRPSWDEYFMGLVDAVSKRGTCDRGRTACVITKDKRILTTGYAGSPPGSPHCDETGHLLAKVIDDDGKVHTHCIRTTHAEQNAVCQAAKAGIALDGGTVYCSMTPCFTCAKLIVSCGIVRVVARKDYHAAAQAKELFAAAGVRFELLDDAVEKYEDQG